MTSDSHPGLSALNFGLTESWKGLVLPDRNDRVKENVPGPYYVDSTCIDCDVCRDTAPDNFMRSDVNSYSFVYNQPTTEAEVAACEEAVLCCPVEAIGSDGDAGN